MHNPLFLPELRSMLAENDDAGLRDVMTELHPATVADFSEGLTTAETWAVMEHAPIERQAEVFAFFPLDKQIDMMSEASLTRAAGVLVAMPHDDRVALLKELDPGVVENLLPMLPKEDREDIRGLFSYPEGSAGSVMTTDFAWLPTELTVDEALARIRQMAAASETIYYLYVLDATRRLVGLVTLRSLVLAQPTDHVGDIMTEEVISVRVDEDQEVAVQKLTKYDFLALPVVDHQNRLVGIITHDDVIDVVVEEATEDVLRMGAVGAVGESYLEVPFRTLWSKRIAWLASLFVLELLTFTALAHYEDMLEQVAVLGLFIPLCISTGGNSGSQASTLITRAMALGQIAPVNWLNVLRREAMIGLALGGSLAIIAYVRAAATPESVLRNSIESWRLALILSQSVGAICLWGVLVGSMLPLVLKRIGIDPGYASGPFVATFVDLTGILIYVNIAAAYVGAGFGGG